MAASSQRLVRTNQPSGQEDGGDEDVVDDEEGVGDEDQVWYKAFKDDFLS